jgi:hypothetical protein
MFYNVEYMDLPSALVALKIDEPNESDMAFVKDRIGAVPDAEKRLFILVSRGQRHIVVAGEVAIAESSMGVFESPFNLAPVKLGNSK